MTHINHDVDKHHCPICNHVCYLIPPKGTGRPRGRPPVARYRAVAILREESSRENPLPIPEFADRLGIAPASVGMVVTRVRDAGYNIRRVPGRGYYLASDDLLVRQPEAQDDSLDVD